MIVSMKKPILPILLAVAALVALGVLISVRMKNSQLLPSSPEVGMNETITTSVTPVPTTSTSIASEISLTVSSPANNAVVKSATIVVRGKTSPNAEVFVNDEETKANSSGNFSVRLTLEEGENYILVVANDAQGKFSERELTITYTP